MTQSGGTRLTLRVRIRAQGPALRDGRAGETGARTSRAATAVRGHVLAVLVRRGVPGGQKIGASEPKDNLDTTSLELIFVAGRGTRNYERRKLRTRNTWVEPLPSEALHDFSRRNRRSLPETRPGWP